jgi:hypothetical protein
MGGCKEDDFLEKLGPQLRGKIRAEGKACPDAETLSAVLDGTAPGPVREQVMEHLMHCAECAALQTRMQAFDDVTVPESAAEWSQQQIRLDNWLDGFLRSERASRAKREGKSLRGFLTWETFSKYLSSAKLQWTLATATALLLVIGSVLLMTLRHPQLPQNQAAVRGAMPQPQSGSPPSTGPAAGPLPASKTLQQPARPAVKGQLASNAKTSSEEKTQKVGSQQKPAATGEVEAHNAPTLTAEANVPPPPTTGSQAAPAPTAIRNRLDDEVTRPTTNTGVRAASNVGMWPRANAAGRPATIAGVWPRTNAGGHSTVPARTVLNVSLQGGGTAQVSRRPNGRVTEVHANGIAIHQSLHGGSITVVAERNGRTIVTTGNGGGYVQRPYLNRGGRIYYQRTYVDGGRTYVQVYRAYYYRGARFYAYAPTYYYHPVFYSWAYNPWATPVYYSPVAWGWAGSPWWGFYGGSFTPYPVYATASLWLTDYLIAANLQAAYQAQAAANAAEAGVQTPLTPDVKQAIADEVQRQLAAERAAAATPQPAAPAPTTEEVPDALNPADRVFVVSSSLDVAVPASGQECSLTAGDVVMRLSDTPDANQTVTASIQSTKKADCPTGQTVAINVQDLQEMHNQFQAQLDSGLKTLADKGGSGGLPKPPDMGTTGGEIPPPAPDSSAAPQLVAQQQQAEQTVAQVQQQINSGQGRNELATTPAAVPYVEGADSKSAAASQSPSTGAKNPNVLRVPGGHGVVRRPSMNAPVHSMAPARRATSPQQSKPAAPAPKEPHP